MLPLSWSLARVSSSSASGVSLRLRNSARMRSTHFEGLAGRGAGVDAEGSGVAVGAEVGVDGVGHAALLADGLEEARTHAAAEHGVEDERGVAVVVGDGRGGHAEADLHLLEGFLVAQQDAGAGLGRRQLVQRLAGGERRKLLRHGLDELVVVQVAGGGKDHVAAVEAVAVVVEELLLVEPGDGGRGAEDGLAEGMIFPEVLGEELVDQDVGIVLVDLDLFEDHAALALDVGGGEDGVEHQVGEDVESDGHVFGQRLDVEADGFLAGEGVEVAADRVHFAGDVLGGAGAGALEEHVFDEVGDAVGFGRLAAGAGLDPHAHGHGAQMLHALGENDQAVGQHGAAKISLGGHCHSVRIRS